MSLWRIFRIFGRPFEAVGADDGVSRRDECISTGREARIFPERSEIGRSSSEWTLQTTENSPRIPPHKGSLCPRAPEIVPLAGHGPRGLGVVLEQFSEVGFFAEHLPERHPAELTQISNRDK